MERNLKHEYDERDVRAAMSAATTLNTVGGLIGILIFPPVAWIVCTAARSKLATAIDIVEDNETLKKRYRERLGKQFNASAMIIVVSLLVAVMWVPSVIYLNQRLNNEEREFNQQMQQIKKDAADAEYDARIEALKMDALLHR